MRAPSFQLWLVASNWASEVLALSPTWAPRFPARGLGFGVGWLSWDSLLSSFQRLMTARMVGLLLT